MSLFSAVLPTFLNKTGEWIENLGDGMERKMNQPKTGILESLKSIPRKVVSLFEKKPQMTFEVGAGLTPEQKIKAEEVVKKVPEVSIQEPTEWWGGIKLYPPKLLSTLLAKAEPEPPIKVGGKYISPLSTSEIMSMMPMGGLKQVSGILKKAIQPSKIDYLLSKSSIRVPSNKIVAPNLPSPGLETKLPLSLTKTLSPAGAFKSTLYSEPSQVKNLDSIDFNRLSSSNLSIIQKTNSVNRKPFSIAIENATGLIPDVRIKKTESLIGKIERYKQIGKNPLEISDNLAGRIVIKENEIPIQLENIKKNFTITESQNFFEKPTEWGYRGINLQAIVASFLAKIRHRMAIYILIIIENMIY